MMSGYVPGLARRNTIRFFYILAGIGVVLPILGLLVTPRQVVPNLLLMGFLIVSMGLSALFFLACHAAAGASWHVSLQRVAEAMADTLKAAAAVMALALVLGLFFLYPWVHPAHAGEGTHVEGATFWFKNLWLSPGFFVGRAVVFLLAWIYFARLMLNHSRAQERDGALSHTHATKKLSVLFLVVFAVTYCLASTDWIMSLTPHWFSTIFGIYTFSGMYCGGLAVLILVAAGLHKNGLLRGVVTTEHFHGLGKLLFGFSIFWMYIWFSQYMLIWYTNIPEETAYFVPRLSNNWAPLLIFNLVLNFGVPFLALLPRGAKRDVSFLVKIACVVLLGRWLDLYLMIMPSIRPEGPNFGLCEIGSLIGSIGLFGLFLQHSLKKSTIIPFNSPFLEESIHHHQ